MCERHSERGPLPPVRNCIYFLSPRPYPLLLVILSNPSVIPSYPSVIPSLSRDLGQCPRTEIPRQARDDRACLGLRSLPFGYAQGRLELGMTERPPSADSPVFAISTIKGKPALPVNFALAVTTESATAGN
jgi:hypothetical protein